MAEFTRVVHAEANSRRLFSSQLAKLASILRLPRPMFKGRKFNPRDVNDERWEIHTICAGDPTLAYSPSLCYSSVYCSWEIGVDICMREAMSRLCHIHRQRIISDFDFHEFGRRNGEGDAVTTQGDRSTMEELSKQMEDTEVFTVNLENVLHSWIMRYYEDMKQKDAIIAGLRAQRNSTQDNDEDDDDQDDNDDDGSNGGDDGGDGTEARPEESEEEPMERVPEPPTDDDSDGEYSPSSKGAKKRKR